MVEVVQLPNVMRRQEDVEEEATMALTVVSQRGLERRPF